MVDGNLLLSIERMCEIPAGSLEPSTPIKNIDTWDSLRVVELVALLDTDYGVAIDYEKLDACKTVGDLLSLVGAACDQGANSKVA